MGVRDRLKKIFKGGKKAPQQTKYLYVSRGGYSSTAAGAKWREGLSHSGATRYIDHYRARQNARDLMHHSLDTRAIVERMTDTIVDTGLKLESTPAQEIIGASPEVLEQWARMAEQRFAMWCSDKQQSRDGSMTFYQAQRLYMFQQQRDNDVFVRLFYSSKKRLQNPLQFSFIDPNQLRGSAWTSTYSNSDAEDGIVRYADGTEKQYKVWIRDPAGFGQYKMITIPRIGEKSGKVMMLHGYTAEYAGQGRGFPKLLVAIQELENLTDFSSAAIKKAINQSNLLLSVENAQRDPSNPLEGITLPDPKVSASGIRIEGDKSEEIIDEISSPQVCPIPEAAVDVPGSVSFVGNAQGDNIRLLETKAPADNFRDFVTTFSERLSAALNIPQEVVLMKFNANYSASRATLLLFWRTVQIWREEMAADFLNPVYKAWLEQEIAASRISAPGWQDPRIKAAWLSCRWIGSPLPSIDPGREASARKDNLEMNLTTLDRESRNLNGSDASTNMEKNRKSFSTMPSPPWGAGGDNVSGE